MLDWDSRHVTVLHVLRTVNGPSIERWLYRAHGYRSEMEFIQSRWSGPTWLSLQKLAAYNHEHTFKISKIAWPQLEMNASRCNCPQDFEDEIAVWKRSSLSRLPPRLVKIWQDVLCAANPSITCIYSAWESSLILLPNGAMVRMYTFRVTWQWGRRVTHDWLIDLSIIARSHTPVKYFFNIFYLFFGYFDPIHIVFVNRNTWFSGWPERYFR